MKIFALAIIFLGFLVSFCTSHASAESCMASVYWRGDGSSGARTASGRPLNDGALTLAHKTARLGSRMRVTNTANGRSALFTVNDRGPYVRGRCVDLTKAGARALGFSGLARVLVGGT